LRVHRASVFAHIVRAYGGLAIKQFARGGLAPWQIRRAYEFIDANLASDPSISDVAEQCGLSSGYFSRAFKRESGFSPHRWLVKRRVERAKELLRGSDLLLAEIAQVCGFVDQVILLAFFRGARGAVRGAGGVLLRRQHDQICRCWDYSPSLAPSQGNSARPLAF
jgi:AraC family transcriptional regulator